MSAPQESTAAPPEAKPASVPPAGRKFPCKQCGARLDFDPAARGLKCPYCGFLEKIEPSADNVKELDFDAYFNKLAGQGTTIAGRSSQVTCTGCGAIVLLEDKLTTDKCPYCLTHLENKPVTAEAMIAPEAVLPFKVDQRQAIEAFNGWLAGRWFAPTGLRHLANLGRLAGLYTPYWTYDSMTYSFYRGQRGDDYTVTESYTETNAQGQTVTKTRQVTHTRWTSVSGEVSHFFDDVLVCASKSLPEDFVRGLEPWDLDQLVDFRAEYLSSFQTERYAVDLGDGFKQAKDLMDGHIRSLCCRDIGGDHQRIEKVNTQHVGVTFKHILMPIWLAAYRYHDQPYRILINARSGAVVGSRPYSFWKIFLFVMAIIALIALVTLLLAGGRAFGAEAPQGALPSLFHTSESRPVLGLKGRFCQPRPKAWECRSDATSTLKGSFVVVRSTNGPFRAEDLFLTCLPGLRPGLTESAFQAEDATRRETSHENACWHGMAG